jgi:hypothetical protein
MPHLQHVVATSHHFSRFVITVFQTVITLAGVIPRTSDSDHRRTVPRKGAPPPSQVQVGTSAQ